MAITEPPSGCMIHNVPFGQYCFTCSTSAWNPTFQVQPLAPVPRGWECPKCHAVCAPWMFSCLTCAATPAPPAPAETCCVCGSGEVTYHNYRERPFCRPCANGEQPRGLHPVHVTVRFTADQQIAKVGREWAEVFPGLQAQHFGAQLDDAGKILVLFRLTPSGGREHD
jgi:hypothetical protein